VQGRKKVAGIKPPQPGRVWPARRVGAVALWLALLGFLLPAAFALALAARGAAPVPSLPAPAEPAPPGGAASSALPALFFVSLLTEGTALTLGLLARRGSLLGSIAAGVALLALITLAVAVVLLGLPAP